jgi:hypothetical protein
MQTLKWVASGCCGQPQWFLVCPVKQLFLMVQGMHMLPLRIGVLWWMARVQEKLLAC